LRAGPRTVLLLAVAALVAAAAAPLPERSVRAQDGGERGERQSGRRRPPAAPAPRRAEVSSSDSRVYVVQFKQWSPFVELSLGDARGLFLVDTGANVSGVDSRWVSASAIPWRPAGRATIGGTTGSFEAEKAAFSRLDLGNAWFTDAVFNLQSFGRWRGRSRPGAWGFAAPLPARFVRVGLLGTDFLNRYQLTLDFRTARLELALRNERRPVPPDHEAVAVGYPLHPTVGTRLAGVSLPVRLDTGSRNLGTRAYLGVNRATVAALKAAGVALASRGSMVVGGITGSSRRAVLGLASDDDPDDGRGGLLLEVGPVAIPDVLLVVHEDGTIDLDHPLGLAGAAVLHHLGRFVLDPFDSVLWVPRPALGPY
jgi:hypothetical protein